MTANPNNPYRSYYDIRAQNSAASAVLDGSNNRCILINAAWKVTRHDNPTLAHFPNYSWYQTITFTRVNYKAGATIEEIQK